MLRYEEDARILSIRDLLELCREDNRVNLGFSRPGARAMISYRFGVWASGLRRGVIKSLALRLYKRMHIFVRNRYGIELYASAKIGRRLFIAHQNAIVLHRGLVMGDDCIIRHGVTVGLGSLESAKRTGWRGPVVGNRVDIGAGTIIVGRISIGNDVVIGPNAVILRSVPSNSLVTATPARVMNRPAGGEEQEDVGRS